MNETAKPPSGGESNTLRDGIDPYEHLARRPDEGERCPHCGGIGRVTPDERLHFVCGLCGGPRLGALRPGLALPKAVEAGLREVEKARRSRAAGRAVAVTSGIAVAVLTLVAAVLAFGTLKGAAVVGIVFWLPFVLALLWGTRSARASDERMTRSLDAAWTAAAVAVARAGQARSPAALAEALGIDEGLAEQLHLQLHVDSEIGSAVPRVRVAAVGTEDEAPQSTLAPDPRFEALESLAPPAAAGAEAKTRAIDATALAPTAAAPSAPMATEVAPTPADAQAAEAEAEAEAAAAAEAATSATEAPRAERS